MFFRYSRACLYLYIALAAPVAQAGVLRVCSDPNNLPFSNQAREGFENRIAELLARDLNATLEYFWWPQRKSFIEKSLDEHRCDVVMGMPATSDEVLVSTPYYRSSYVFVSREDRHLELSSLSDERLAHLRIGIHVVGDDYAPPAYALTRRGLAGNLHAFSLFGPADEANPASKLLDAVTRGDVDVAIAWGPLAGYFAKLARPRVTVAPVAPSMFMGVPFSYAISVGVRKGDDELKRRIDEVLVRECAAVQEVLTEYGVPQQQEDKPQCAESRPLRSALSR